MEETTATVFEKKFTDWCLALGVIAIADPGTNALIALGYTALAVMRACYLHPEWLQGVMAESSEFWDTGYADEVAIEVMRRLPVEVRS